MTLSADVYPAFPHIGGSKVFLEPLVLMTGFWNQVMEPNPMRATAQNTF